jgi:hypothetical protein
MLKAIHNFVGQKEDVWLNPRQHYRILAQDRAETHFADLVELLCKNDFQIRNQHFAQS